MLLDTLLPGHFGLPLTPADRAHMQEAGAKASTGAGSQSQKQPAVSDAMQHHAARQLRDSISMLGDIAAHAHPRLAAAAALRLSQEARVYARTGSRFFELPHCPEEPEYPPDVPILRLLGNWHPDDVAVPARHHSTLCRIDYQVERAKALRYRRAEVPFVVYNVPDFDETVRKWAQPGYVARRLGPQNVTYPMEISRDNHFLYTKLTQTERELRRQRSKDYDPPSEKTNWSYMRWLAEARKGQDAPVGPASERARPHHYLSVNDNNSDMVRDDLTIFQRKNGSLFVADLDMKSHIECRVGTRGIVVEGHYDGLCNMAGVVSGTRRWILAQPRHCHHAYLRPFKDASGRQSKVDWARPDLDKYPDFKEMRAHELILAAGEVLYIPPFWLHYVVLLDAGAQCNYHNGESDVGREHVEACGFVSEKKKEKEEEEEEEISYLSSA